MRVKLSHRLNNHQCPTTARSFVFVSWGCLGNRSADPWPGSRINTFFLCRGVRKLILYLNKARARIILKRLWKDFKLILITVILVVLITNEQLTSRALSLSRERTRDLDKQHKREVPQGRCQQTEPGRSSDLGSVPTHPNVCGLNISYLPWSFCSAWSCFYIKPARHSTTAGGHGVTHFPDPTFLVTDSKWKQNFSTNRIKQACPTCQVNSRCFF